MNVIRDIPFDRVARFDARDAADAKQAQEWHSAKFHEDVGRLSHDVRIDVLVKRDESTYPWIRTTVGIRVFWAA